MKSRAELQQQEFSNRDLLRAVYRLPDRLEKVPDEARLFARVMRDVLEALPRAEAVAVVRRPPLCPPGELEVQVLEYATRSRPGARSEFRPSRRLVKRALCEQECSCLCAWPSGTAAGSEMTMPNHGPRSGADVTIPHYGQRTGAAPWAVCTPFQDDSQYALYVEGFEEPLGNGLPDPAYLNDCQKFAELVAKITEAALKTVRLRQQIEVAKLAWPKNMRALLNDPGKLEQLLLKPVEAEITILFCDLRGYSRYAEETGANLHTAFAEVQKALDVMSSAVTEKGGIVAGFRGDAVLAFWGWPEPQPDAVARAAGAATRIFERLTGPTFRRKCGLGLTHGTALVGRLGAHDLAIIDLYGPVVNLAFRLEEMTKAFGTGIVISDDIATHVRNADPSGTTFRTRPLGTVVPRGVKNPLPVHELVPREPILGYPSWLTENGFKSNMNLWKAALELFAKGKWAEAHLALDDHFHSDPAAQYLMNFMAKSNKVPPLTWKGVIEEPKKLD